ncbi:hypothetical protein [Pseudarthrobacter sp. NIBRBAC000502771]|uniref:hypothetical protein n=1 Tax=Pseudarthrobacter sp. NIBRBAC000502771 TaxID=2590774 RepID=UPI00352CD428
MALLDRLRVVAFPPAPDLGPEPGRDQFTGRCAPGRIGCVGVEEMRHQPGSPDSVKAFGFVGDDAGVLPRHGPGGQGLEHRR